MWVLLSRPRYTAEGGDNSLGCRGTYRCPADLAASHEPPTGPSPKPCTVWEERGNADLKFMDAQGKSKAVTLVVAQPHFGFPSNPCVGISDD